MKSGIEILFNVKNEILWEMLSSVARCSFLFLIIKSTFYLYSVYDVWMPIVKPIVKPVVGNCKTNWQDHLKTYHVGAHVM